MRGKEFHNMIAAKVGAICKTDGWNVYAEHPYRKDSIITYLDLLIVKNGKQIACEIETTPRHAIDNAAKAMLVGIDLWIIVASRKVRNQINRKLISTLPPNSCNSISILLLDQLKTKLESIQERKVQL